MITKQNKLKQIKKQMDQVNRKTGSPVKFSKMADIVTDSLAKLKHITEADLIGLNRDAEDGDEYKQEADVEDSKEKHQGLKVDSKGLTSAAGVPCALAQPGARLQDRGIPVRTAGAEQRLERGLGPAEQTAGVSGEVSVGIGTDQHVANNNLKIENSVEFDPFSKAVQILYSLEDKEIENTWKFMTQNSEDDSTVDFKDMCVWVKVEKFEFNKNKSENESESEMIIEMS
eukprot:CAMPEP_0116986980 /NCGR_PEP_ID=MMETSP0467-20121206/63223_1 /TAXON_ID=283647 /ORGANISM="Mesodinium pulex, Strain SPMC105" /LENGTH=228 /DNA_ID=CAMNT_0004682691 /DNA_START=407 /DNA_END=1094 /DNA_ORIENTATION=+